MVRSLVVIHVGVIAVLGSATLPAQSSPTPFSPPSIEEREISWKKILPNILDDQKSIWTFPVKPLTGKDVLPTVGVLGVTAGLIALDPYDSPYFRRTTSYSGFN